MQRQKLEGMGGWVGMGECSSPSAWNARSFDLMSKGQSPVYIQKVYWYMSGVQPKARYH